MPTELMLAGLVFAAIVAVSPMRTEDAREAIWSDLELNAWIGNGNDAVSLEWWIGVDRGKTPRITIVDVRCASDKERGQCRFDLERDAAPGASGADQAQAKLLACTAEFVFVHEDGEPKWMIKHSPPLRHRGHSRTTMKCRVQRSV